VRNAPDSIRRTRAAPLVYVDIKDRRRYLHEDAQRTVAEDRCRPATASFSMSSSTWKGQVPADGHHPLTVLIIFVIIYVYQSTVKTGIVFLAVPFSCRAFWFMYALDYDTSIAVWVGVIAGRLRRRDWGGLLLHLDLAHKLWGATAAC
jgi:Cu(I)/Ag(I) efflux system membrane protein CusA/SilA